MATSGAHVQIIELMQQFHYTATEARLYLSLLEGSPATGYELAHAPAFPARPFTAHSRNSRVKGW